MEQKYKKRKRVRHDKKELVGAFVVLIVLLILAYFALGQYG